MDPMTVNNEASAMTGIESEENTIMARVGGGVEGWSFVLFFLLSLVWFPLGYILVCLPSPEHLVLCTAYLLSSVTLSGYTEFLLDFVCP